MHKQIGLIISCINLKQIGHASGLAFLSVASHGLFRNFGSGLVQLQLDYLELHTAHSQTPSPARTFRQREQSNLHECICMSCCDGNKTYINPLQDYNLSNPSYIVKQLIYQILGNRLQSITYRDLVHKRTRVIFQNATNSFLVI